MIKLGYHPATWGGMLEGLWKGIGCMSACNWDGIEYCYGDLCQWYDRPDEFRARLDEHGVSLASIYISSGFRDADEVAEHRARVEAAAAFAARIGCEFILLDGGARKELSRYDDTDFQRVADAANRCGEICREAGVYCSWHQHWGSMFEFQEDFDRLMEMTDPELVLCTPDTAQFSLGDFDVVPAVRRYARRIKYIHFKDLDRKRRFTELGRGTVDFWGCWEALQAADFDGWIVVDLDYTSLTPDEACRVNKAYLNEILGIRGVRDGACALL